MTDSQQQKVRWRLLVLTGLPPEHIAYQLGDDDEGPVIKIQGPSGDYLLGHGKSKAEAIGNARGKLHNMGGFIA